MLNSIVKLHANETEKNKGEDWISNSADDVLIQILSYLGLMESVKTSLLSKRWRYLWTNLVDLDFFDNSEMFIECETNPKLAYASRVTQLVSMHRGPMITIFRVRHHLGESYSNHIDEWVKFAISKGVKYLELDLGTSDKTGASAANYTLKSDVFRVSRGINLLTSLSLTSVNVDGGTLELVLSVFNGLERLFVEDSKDLVSFKVRVESCRKLKYLGIRNCREMELLQLGAVNLRSFEFITSDELTRVEYNNVPSLVEASFGGDYCHALQLCNFQNISSFSSQLSNLSLHISKDRFFSPVKFPSFHNVKRLELTVCLRSVMELHTFTSYLEAFPSLLELELRVHDMNYAYKKEICSELKLQTPPPNKQFCLHFLERRSDFNDINEWIKCALSRRVEKLMLHTAPNNCFMFNLFPLQCHVLKNSSCIIGLGYLKSLCLRNVSISGEVLEYVLSHCNLLEELRVESSNDLVNFKVTDELSNRLKYLAISHCSNMKSLEICALNLSRFEFSGPESVKVAYNGLPSLVEVVLSGKYCDHQLLPRFNQISCFSHQLVKLSLNLVEAYQKHIEFPAFPNVKHLELSVTPSPLASFAEACPVLHKLKLEIWWKCPCLNFYSNEDVKYATSKDAKQCEEIKEEAISDTCTLPNLKILEWIEYHGVDHVKDMELAEYIVKKAHTLEKLVCHTSDPWFQFCIRRKSFRTKAIGRTINHSDSLEYQICHDRRNYMYKPKLEDRKKFRDASRCRAQRLATSLPSSVNVYII